VGIAHPTVISSCPEGRFAWGDVVIILGDIRVGTSQLRTV
jgi:hypothetical protein